MLRMTFLALISGSPLNGILSSVRSRGKEGKKFWFIVNTILVCIWTLLYVKQLLSALSCFLCFAYVCVGLICLWVCCCRHCSDLGKQSEAPQPKGRCHGKNLPTCYLLPHLPWEWGCPAADAGNPGPAFQN